MTQIDQNLVDCGRLTDLKCSQGLAWKSDRLIKKYNQQTDIFVNIEVSSLTMLQTFFNIITLATNTFISQEITSSKVKLKYDLTALL